MIYGKNSCLKKIKKIKKTLLVEWPRGLKFLGADTEERVTEIKELRKEIDVIQKRG